MKPNERMMTTTALYWLAAIYAVLAIVGATISRGQNATERVLPAGRSVQAMERKLYRVTAYCACKDCCPGSADRITADGHRISPGDQFVAAPKSFRFGMIVTVPGYGTVPVRDRGILIDDTVAKKMIKVNGKYVTRKTADFDVFFSSHNDAKNWGVQILEVTYGNCK